ncbi:MAG: hypothetical protein E7Z96_05645 [Actinomycetaceae bacterium]|nr:hypothetical protein [Actinomycetaceae bacterium]
MLVNDRARDAAEQVRADVDHRDESQPKDARELFAEWFAAYLLCHRPMGKGKAVPGPLAPHRPELGD